MILSFFFFSSRRRHTRLVSDWSSDVCSSDLSHVLKNALIPVVTVLGLQLGTLIGGAVITEYVFALPGVGQIGRASCRERVEISGVAGSLKKTHSHYVHRRGDNAS